MFPFAFLAFYLNKLLILRKVISFETCCLNLPPFLQSRMREQELLSAAETGDVQTLRFMLLQDRDFNINCTDMLGRTPLQLAVNNEHQEVRGREDIRYYGGKGRGASDGPHFFHFHAVLGLGGGGNGQITDWRPHLGSWRPPQSGKSLKPPLGGD